MLYLAANGDPAASAERPRWDLESNTRRVCHLPRALPGRSRRLPVVGRGLRRPARRGVAGDAGVAATAVRDLEAGVGAVPAVLLPSVAARVGSYVNVRFFGAYGPYEPPRKITTQVAAGAGAPASASSSIRGDGQNLIDFMYVDDAVDGLLALVKAQGEQRTVDFASGAPVSVNDIVATMATNARRRRDGPPRRHVAEYIEFRSVGPDDARAVRRRAVDFVRRRPDAAVGISRARSSDVGTTPLRHASENGSCTSTWPKSKATTRRSPASSATSTRCIAREVIARVTGLPDRDILEVGCGEGMMFDGTGIAAGADGRLDARGYDARATRDSRLLCGDGYHICRLPTASFSVGAADRGARAHQRALARAGRGAARAEAGRPRDHRRAERRRR